MLRHGASKQLKRLDCSDTRADLQPSCSHAFGTTSFSHDVTNNPEGNTLKVSRYIGLVDF